MRQRLVWSTVAVALGALLVLGLPLLFFVDRLARAEALALPQRPAEGIATGPANNIAPGQALTPPRSGMEEVDTIAAALDSSAARIAALVQSEREFSANASHQLRSALTSLRLRLEALAAADDPAVAGEAARALEQAERLSDTVAELLRLARTGRADDAQTFDLSGLASAHLRDLSPRFQAEG